ncbi:hypothetical protein V6N12_035359 [Hibiscus sabdariffa]|uniref:Uncharacterized protein n=1 Tax=Hibiscus sabdariffa TaxID=183260 RepID=A0ABR2BS99_9ROSI
MVASARLRVVVVPSSGGYDSVERWGIVWWQGAQFRGWGLLQCSRLLLCICANGTEVGCWSRFGNHQGSGMVGRGAAGAGMAG